MDGEKAEEDEGGVGCSTGTSPGQKGVDQVHDDVTPTPHPSPILSKKKNLVHLRP